MLKLYRNQTGLSSVELLAYASVGVILAITLSQLNFYFNHEKTEGIDEASEQIESKLQDAFSFNINDCPVNTSTRGQNQTESMKLHTINLSPLENESMFPELDHQRPSWVENIAFQQDARRSAIYEPTDEDDSEIDVESDDDETDTASLREDSIGMNPLFVRNATMLDDVEQLSEGDIYTVDTSSGPQFVKLMSLKIDHAQKGSLSKIKASIQALNSDRSPVGNMKEIQVVVRTVNSGRDQVCWAIANLEAENCYSNGGTPLDDFGKCHYQSKESLARATCAAAAVSGQIKNSEADLAACRLGFMKGANGEAAAL